LMDRTSDNFIGGPFVWFTGVVEDINDPEMMSRVRVRCFGFHTDSKGLISTDSLPWATVMGPTTSAHVSGIGNALHGLVQGSWVVGFFRDGPSAQDPVIMGTIGSTYEEAPNSNFGFADPDGQYPTIQQGDSTYIDTNALSRGINTVERTLDSVIGEPPSAYAAEYPHNKVTETTSGHLIEIDDTPGSERIRVRHTSGTFVELHPNGDVVQSNSNKYQITSGNDSVHVTGQVNIIVDGNINLTANSNLNAQVSGTTSLTCPTTNIQGDVNITGDLNISGTSTASGDHVSAGISGKGHTHRDTPGLGAGTTTPPQ
jgi:hypothetical protein